MGRGFTETQTAYYADGANRLMADIHTTTSTYESGTNDTATTLVANVDDVLAKHQNGPASAITQMQTILGLGTTLKGSTADLATRLAIALNATGKLNDFSATTKTTWPITVTECGTGTVTLTDEEVLRYQATGDKLESTGYTLPASTGVICTLDDTQTLTLKTLTTPTITTPVIASFASATHTHLNAAGGGLLGADSVGTTQVKLSTETWTSSIFNGSAGHTEAFDVPGSRVSDFHIDPTSGAGVISLLQIHPGNDTAIFTRWQMVVDNTGGGGSSESVTITWSILATVT